MLELALGEPVLFPLYTSTVRGDDKPGQVLRLPPESLLQLPPLHTVLRGGKRAGAKRVPVTLAAKCTEIGTLELYCESKEGNRWRLEFNVRDVLREPTKEDEETDANGRGDRRVPRGEGASRRGADRGSVRRAASVSDRRASPSLTLPARRPPPTFPSCSKRRWSRRERTGRPGLCRRMWEFLEAHAAGRGKSPAHLSRWYNLTGFVLRPGFGDPVDRYRVEALWKLITAGREQLRTSGREEAAGRARRRGGLLDHVAARQRRAERGAAAGALHAAASRRCCPAKGKAFSRPPANEYAEMWRAAASLERLDAKTKEALGAAVLPRLQEVAGADVRVLVAHAARRRVQLYGPLELGRSPRDRRTVDRGAAAVQAEQRQRAERLAVLPRGAGPAERAACGGCERPDAQPRTRRAAFPPLSRRVEADGGRGRRG